VLSFAHTTVGRALLGLIAAACGGDPPSRRAGGGLPDSPSRAAGGEAEDLLAWLRAPGLLPRPSDIDAVDRLEADVRRTGTVSAAHTRALWEADGNRPLEELDRLRAAAALGGAVLTGVLERELERLACVPRLARAHATGDPLRRGLDRAADEESRALAAGRAALRALGAAAGEHAVDAAELTAGLQSLQIASAESHDQLTLDDFDQTTEPASAFAPPRPLAPLRDPTVLDDLRQRPWSASSLELWSGCPARWFVERHLRARDLDPPPEPIARGGLAHAVLKDTLDELRRRTGSARLTPPRLELARELLHAALDARADEFPLSVEPERVPGVRRRLEADLERYLEHAAACDSPLEPAHLELGFGFDGDDDGGSVDGGGGVDRDGDDPPSRGAGGALPALDLGDGVRLRGRIDRIDVGPGGEAVVYDYKGRTALPAARWAGERSLQVPLYMRAARDLLGLDPVGGFYQPLAGRDLRARGALAQNAGVKLDCVSTDRRDTAELAELIDDAVARARAAAAEARDGALEGRPHTCAFTGGCMYPAICRCEG